MRPGDDGRTNAALETARRVFAEIRISLPDLEMTDDTQEIAAASGGGVGLSMTIPVQPGNRYEINLNLQNVDELHFQVMNFHCEWFPCTKPECADQFIGAV